MKILSIETSCDETAISLVDAEGEIDSPRFKILGNALFSQINLHKDYGGVYPNLAKREHARNLTPLLKKVLDESKEFLEYDKLNVDSEDWDNIKETLKREYGLFEPFREYLEKVGTPNIDVISVTSGPGLAPALWVGISFASALSKLWNIPVLGINHMEGHIASILIENTDKRQVDFPAIALLISGGHTELVKISHWGKYEILGKTLDDAVGEAFDKVARMLGLPYPGGPEVSKLAEKARVEETPHEAKFTRPMINSKDLNFSFSGLKTAVLYYIRDLTDNGRIMLSEKNKADIAREFEDTVIDVLFKKTIRTIEENEVKTLIIAGGVIANRKIASEFSNLENKYNNLKIITPTKSLSTDNSLMIASATYINLCLFPELLKKSGQIIALGNLSLSKNS